ncbi:MAG: hypothetical protein KA314_08195 [Chloroflexi bacterium]|nr:hypothetical protein [Chloroflexota bacterium]MBP8055810.1 hypothetical protein [Chloroflexota bacterium]
MKRCLPHLFFLGFLSLLLFACQQALESPWSGLAWARISLSASQLVS